MATIFTKIINGEIPAYKIDENDKYLAFLDINPIAMGHVLVIPKREVDYIFNLEDEELAGLMAFSKQISKALIQAVPCKRIGVTVIGLEVPHTHIHLVPINNVDDMNFGKPKLKLTNEQLELIRLKIKSFLK
ncbi:MAG: HIT family protein [Bacteroidia bacterium]|jgi:histidine triad (HIT) family protein|nr:HIT family protein [Bacteroidia bacterium]MCC7515489.1 HIT family protein [Bacteroidia bacterium]HMU78585.1 HIT family protein [Bacteroidia bacterium]HMW09923.1 HIT family protein [Bacteroidia bacterium]HMX98106.1 HIT family protein [Bacteroidia bacterium]